MDERELPSDPLRAARAWLAEAEAAGVAAPETMTLATAGADGAPSARMVLLKGVDDRGFLFFTNRESRKGRELDANPRAALVLYWQPLGRQVRAEGRVERLSDEESTAYFRTRPRGSRIAAWASPQSRPLADRAELEALVAAADAAHPGEDVPLPPFWGGYLVVPDAVELWEHRPSRLHDRIRWERTPDGWRRARLAP